MAKVFLLKSLGCRLNVAELTEMGEELERQGWSKGDNPSLVIINSCSVTHKADKETRQLIRQMRRKYPEAKLVVTGCFVGYDKLTDQAKKMKEYVDLWVLNKDKDELIKKLIDYIKVNDRSVKCNERYEK